MVYLLYSIALAKDNNYPVLRIAHTILILFSPITLGYNKVGEWYLYIFVSHNLYFVVVNTGILISILVERIEY